MGNQDEWETFTLGRSAARVGKPKIGIQANGRFGVNAAAKEFLGDFALLRYNSKRQQIGFMPATEDTKGAYPVRPTKNQENTFGLSGQAFIAYYGIDLNSVKGLYSVTEQDGALILQLPGESSPSDQAGKRAR